MQMIGLFSVKGEGGNTGQKEGKAEGMSSLEWLTDSLEWTVDSLEWTSHSSERISDSLERLNHSGGRIACFLEGLASSREGRDCS